MRPSYCYLLTRALPEGGCRYYVGIRPCPVGKTPETDTTYMGSGRRIKSAVKASGVTPNAASRGRVKPGQLRLARDGC